MPELRKIRKNDVDYDIKDEAARKEIEDLRKEVPKIPTNVSAFENDAGYLTKHQDISGKLDADKLPEALNDALTQAKESGEFDGITPDFSIGTVQTLDAGSNATASISGTKEKPVLNLGIPKGMPSEGDNSVDKWELLNTITVSDDETTNVTLTEDSNGNPLDLKKFYLKVSGIEGTTTYPVLRLNGLNWQQQFGGPAKSGTNVTIPVLFEIISEGCYCCEWHNPFQKEIRFDGEKTGGGGIQSHIDSVNSIYWGWATGKNITNGAIFTLYGVRA